MGGIEATFGRNAPSLPGDPERSPSAREVSEALFTRHTFLPASHLNVIAAAWLQFEVHDWVMHDKTAEHWDLGDGMALPKALHRRRAHASSPTRRTGGTRRSSTARATRC